MTSPFDIAWSLLKGLEHQQMFSANSPPGNLQDFSERPQDYGLRREGTVHPAIYGMLQRKLIADRASKRSGMDPIESSSAGVIRPPKPGEPPSPEYDKELQRYYTPNLRISKPEGYGGLEGGPIQNQPLSARGDYQQGYESGSLFSTPYRASGRF